MPRETFHNLPAAKRERFVQAAAHEFADHGFDGASITRLVRTLGIAKGSVYQYFDDKVDLFAWLVEEAGRRKLAAATPPDLAADADIFDRLAATYAQGLRVRGDPVWIRLGLRLQEPTAEPRVAALRVGLDAQVVGWLHDTLAAAQAAGELRADVDLDVAVRLVQGVLQDGLRRAFGDALGCPLEDLADAFPPPGDPRWAGAEAAAALAVDLLRRALGAHPS